MSWLELSDRIITRKSLILMKPGKTCKITIRLSLRSGPCIKAQVIKNISSNIARYSFASLV